MLYLNDKMVSDSNITDEIPSYYLNIKHENLVYMFLSPFIKIE